LPDNSGIECVIEVKFSHVTYEEPTLKAKLFEALDCPPHEAGIDVYPSHSATVGSKMEGDSPCATGKIKYTVALSESEDSDEETSFILACIVRLEPKLF
jgi:hypothetical protein